MSFAERYGPWAVVAGASEGVGASLARQLGERGVNVVLVARNRPTLDEVARQVATQTRTVVLDLAADGADESLAKATADLEVGLLVYNAGADPHMSRFLDKPADVWQAMLTRNCTTVLGAVHHFAGRMLERKRGGIALVTSGAAWAGGSHLAVYGASKAFDLLLAESLWAELGPQGIDVLAMVLGRTDTPAFRRLVGGRLPDAVADPEDVARDLLENLGNGPTFPPGPPPFGTLARRDAVGLMSRGAATLHD
ncbi:MAG TPA: SDR family NAD(P)-dependent oxidoreductase [Myxococcota bacterium]|nr:SDR family NAD(P)-dependent oxidoreductase [Myxococcota bacterium]